MSKKEENNTDSKGSLKLGELMGDINKLFGKGSIIELGKSDEVEVECNPVGVPSIDICLGGGFPVGRIIEVYGPESSGKTSCCLMAIAEAQKKGHLCGFVDVEQALDVKYAATLGVDTSKLILSQPDYGEAALEILDKMIESGLFKIIIFDSIAAITPKAELEGEMGEAKMGVVARLMAQALRKITAKTHKTGTTVIFINQLREKIGIVYGCLHADMPILFTDGRSIPIREVVENKIQGNVLSYNETTKTFEEKPIIDWHYNGKVGTNSDYLHIETVSIDGAGRFGITVTPDHEVLTDKGWKKAKNITFDDSCVSKYESTINSTLKEFLDGCFCGDVNLQKGKERRTFAIKFQDSQNNEYVNWKINKLNMYKFSKLAYEERGKNYEKFTSNYTHELYSYRSSIDNRNPILVFKDRVISDLSLAIWIMDDGHFQKSHRRYRLSMNRFSKNLFLLGEIKKLFEANSLNGKFSKRGEFTFTVTSSKEIAKRICKFVPDCMQYKLDEPFKGLYEEFTLDYTKELRTDLVEIKDIRNASDRQLRQKGKYDITIQDNHNYLSGGIKNGVIIHNSPEVTTGGNSMKFYASQRIDIRKGPQIKLGDKVIGGTMRFKVVKNKIAPPFRTSELEVIFGEGIDIIKDYLSVAVDQNIIQKSGSWYKYGETSIGQGLDKVKDLMLDNPELFEEIKSKLKLR